MRDLGIDFGEPFEQQPLPVIANVITRVIPIMIRANLRCKCYILVSLAMNAHGQFVKSSLTLFKTKDAPVFEKNERIILMLENANAAAHRNLTVFTNAWQSNAHALTNSSQKGNMRVKDGRGYSWKKK